MQKVVSYDSSRGKCWQTMEMESNLEDGVDRKKYVMEIR